jgi:hypothetical protein
MVASSLGAIKRILKMKSGRGNMVSGGDGNSITWSSKSEREGVFLNISNRLLFIFAMSMVVPLMSMLVFNGIIIYIDSAELLDDVVRNNMVYPAIILTIFLLCVKGVMGLSLSDPQSFMRWALTKSGGSSLSMKLFMLMGFTALGVLIWVCTAVDFGAVHSTIVTMVVVLLVVFVVEVKLISLLSRDLCIARASCSDWEMHAASYWASVVEDVKDGTV